MFKYPLGLLGVVLIALTTWAVQRLGRPRRAERLAGRAVLYVVVMTGRLVDHLTGRHQTPPAPPRRWRQRFVDEARAAAAFSHPNQD
jgi:heme A synthase